MRLQRYRIHIAVVLLLAAMVFMMVIPKSETQAADKQDPIILCGFFPEYETVLEGTEVSITHYFYDETGMGAVYINGKLLSEETTPAVVKDSDKLWHVTRTFTENSKFAHYSAEDTAGNSTLAGDPESLRCFTEEPDGSFVYTNLTQDALLFLDDEGNEIERGSRPYYYVTLGCEIGEEDNLSCYFIEGNYADKERIYGTTINGKPCFPVEKGGVCIEIEITRHNERIGCVLFVTPEWEEPEYEWNELSSVTATMHRADNASIVYTETAKVTSEVTLDPTCENMGKTTYTAVFKDPLFLTQSKVFTDIEALGHNWGSPSYEWSSDYKTMTAVRYCTRDSSHKESEVAVATSKVTKQPTCLERGEVTYSVTFNNPVFEPQSITVDTLPPNGHQWGMVLYQWSEDLTSVTASAICLTDSTHTKTETAQSVRTVMTDPTCTEEGEVVYTASFVDNVFATQTKWGTEPALGHSYGEATYTWSDDNTTVQAKRVCTHDESHVETETVATTKVITKAPTATEDGEVTYTAVFQNGAFVQQTKTEVIPKLGGSTYRLVSGADSTYTLGTNTSLQFIYSRSTDDETSIYHFQGLKVDGAIVNSVYYVVRSGSVIVDISGVYLETLSSGDHILTAMFDDGDDVTVTFKVTGGSATPSVTYKVVFNANGHGDWPDTQTVENGKTVARPQDPTADGYVFGGWYMDSACTVAFNFSTPITQNTTLYAKWTMAGSTPGGTDNTSSYNNTDTTPTGDDSHAVLWICLMLVSLAGAGMSLMNAKKQKA